jgi:AcrR family transcriptional regulator
VTAAAHRTRQPRAERERQVLAAARALFAERGYGAVTMDDVAAAVGVTKPLLYVYFGNKERLYLACMEPAAEELREAVTGAVAEAEAALRRWTGDYEQAVALAADLEPACARQQRQVLAQAYDKLGRQAELISLLSPPRTVNELVQLVSLLIDQKRFDEAEHHITQPCRVGRWRARKRTPFSDTYR